MTAAPLTARQEEIVGVARDLLTREGVEALTLGRVAGALGIKPPSLYKHFPSKRALEAVLIAEGMRDVGGGARGRARRSPRSGPPIAASRARTRSSTG